MNTISGYFSSMFGGRVRKISVNAGLGCPNRDGTLGTSGCIYCNNAAFNPAYAYQKGGSITEQIQEGIRFCSRKCEDVIGYLPYFQSFTGTYGATDHLVSLYEEALACPGVLGLVIATRPDCLSPDLLDWFERRFGGKAPEEHPYLLMEIGVESTLDSTLQRIGRGHSWECSRNAILDLGRRGIDVGVHLILGLPGETRQDWETHVRKLASLPVRTIKFHQIQIIKGTPLAAEYASDSSCVHIFTPQEYADTLKSLIALLPDSIVLDRLVSEAPEEMLIAPRWGLKPDEFVRRYF